MKKTNAFGHPSSDYYNMIFNFRGHIKKNPLRQNAANTNRLTGVPNDMVFLSAAQARDAVTGVMRSVSNQTGHWKDDLTGSNCRDARRAEGARCRT